MNIEQIFDELHKKFLEIKDKEYILTAWKFDKDEDKIYKRLDDINNTSIRPEFNDYHFYCVGKFIEIVHVKPNGRGGICHLSNVIALIFKIKKVFNQKNKNTFGLTNIENRKNINLIIDIKHITDFNYHLGIDLFNNFTFNEHNINAYTIYDNKHVVRKGTSKGTSKGNTNIFDIEGDYKDSRNSLIHFIDNNLDIAKEYFSNENKIHLEGLADMKYRIEKIFNIYGLEGLNMMSYYIDEIKNRKIICDFCKNKQNKLYKCNECEMSLCVDCKFGEIDCCDIK